MLSTNEVRARAAKFAEEWRDACYERGEAQSFYNDFFDVFGMKRRQVATFEEPVKRLGNKRGFIDLFWKGVLLVEQKSSGQSLVKAKEQALDYFPGLKPAELPRYILVSDFQNFELHDLDDPEEGTQAICFKLPDLPKHIERFNFIRGLEKRVFRDQDPVNVAAAELVGKLHDALKESGYTGHNLERLLVRLVFCLFADDTGIFEPRDIFFDLLTNRTNEDGSDTGLWLTQLFDVLNRPEDKRQKTLDEDLVRFPYVNGDLFAEPLPPASFDSKMRKLLIEVCDFRWDVISPAIFGALFQCVMEPAERRKKGAHYTTELNILKLIRPLFLDRLHRELDDIKLRRGVDRRNKLHAFHERLASLRFFDPACGCGNFLVITYRELRRLEIQVLKEIYLDEPDFNRGLVVSKIDVDQFYGIEVEEFPARIAETAMWMMDHITNNELSLAFGKQFLRIPLKKSASIHNCDALEMDWATVIQPDRCDFIFGNPPFGGAKLQSENQRKQVLRVANLDGRAGTLDYVTAWFVKAGDYVRPHSCSAQVAFVATSSVSQGEQVGQLWPVLFNRYGLEISFAHRTFAWGSDARGMAHVHVVIIGLVKRAFEAPEKRLFSYDDVHGSPVESVHRALSPYLFDASGLRDRHLVVLERSRPLCDVPKAIIGSKPIDGGYLILTEEERTEFARVEPAAAKFLRPYIGGVDYIHGTRRWILSLQEASPSELRSLPHVLERLRLVREYREGRRPAKDRNGSETPAPRGISSKALARAPTQFHVTVIPKAPFLAIPEVSSERREYIPIGWLEPPVIPSNLVRIILDADLWHFGILTSRMHMTWLRYIGGRLESRYRYSINIVYNTFPWPDASETVQSGIHPLARSVLEARAKFPGATLADLYDSDTMKPELRAAHRNLDKAIDLLYKRSGFASDRERIEHLFALYEKLSSPLIAALGKPKRRRKSALGNEKLGSAP